MRRHNLKKLAFLLATGSIILQAPACTDVATVVTGWASAITAGSAVYLVYEILS